MPSGTGYIFWVGTLTFLLVLFRPTNVSTPQLRPSLIFLQGFVLCCCIVYILLVIFILVLLNNLCICRVPSEKPLVEAGPDGQDPKRQEWFTKYFSFWEKSWIMIFWYSCLFKHILFNAQQRPRRTLITYFAFSHKYLQSGNKINGKVLL